MFFANIVFAEEVCSCFEISSSNICLPVIVVKPKLTYSLKDSLKLELALENRCVLISVSLGV